jgi:hypothetical protein
VIYADAKYNEVMVDTITVSYPYHVENKLIGAQRRRITWRTWNFGVLLGTSSAYKKAVTEKATARRAKGSTTHHDASGHDGTRPGRGGLG